MCCRTSLGRRSSPPRSPSATSSCSRPGLSYLGIGVRPPTASWGTIIQDGAERVSDLWWLTLFPGLAILVTVFACNALGDALRDALDPRQLHPRHHRRDLRPRGMTAPLLELDEPPHLLLHRQRRRARGGRRLVPRRRRRDGRRRRRVGMRQERHGPLDSSPDPCTRANRGGKRDSLRGRRICSRSPSATCSTCAAIGSRWCSRSR